MIAWIVAVYFLTGGLVTADKVASVSCSEEYTGLPRLDMAIAHTIAIIGWPLIVVLQIAHNLRSRK